LAPVRPLESSTRYQSLPRPPLDTGMSR
jgi:hypothetical protein